MLHNLLSLGGDNRRMYMAQRLRQAGLAVRCADTIDAAAAADGIILPLPVTTDQLCINGTQITLDAFCAAVTPLQVVFAGKLPQTMQTTLTDAGVRVFDYYARPEFSRKNAIPTAHGVLLYVMRHTQKIVSAQQIAVIGYGACGREIAKAFRALGAQVTVAARKYAALAEAQADGHAGVLLRHLHTVLPHADVVINTVPAQILRKAEIDLLREDALPIDVASFPYGFDSDYAASVGKPVRKLPSIPGKYFSETAGGIIADTIFNIMEEEGLYIP